MVTLHIYAMSHGHVFPVKNVTVIIPLKIHQHCGKIGIVIFYDIL